MTNKNVYYFPLYYNHAIQFTLRVYEDNSNSYAGILSEYLAAELQSLSDATTIESPLKLFINNGNIIKSINGECEIIVPDPSGNPVMDTAAITIGNSETIVNIEDRIPYQLVPKAGARAATSKYLSLDLAETQGSQTWCSAFTGSSIIRYKKSNKIYAKDIMKYYFPNSKDLNNESITHTQLISYAKLKGITPKKSTSTLSQASVVAEIDGSRPVYLSCDGTGTYKKANHALVLRGYNTSTQKYSVWNPWYDYYETMPISTKTYTVDSSSSFVWKSTIYNWK